MAMATTVTFNATLGALNGTFPAINQTFFPGLNASHAEVIVVSILLPMVSLLRQIFPVIQSAAVLALPQFWLIDLNRKFSHIRIRTNLPVSHVHYILQTKSCPSDTKGCINHCKGIGLWQLAGVCRLGLVGSWLSWEAARDEVLPKFWILNNMTRQLYVKVAQSSKACNHECIIAKARVVGNRSN